MTNPGEMIDVLWILVCAALVMLMQAGFACLESGAVRTKNSINVAAKNFTDFLKFCKLLLLFYAIYFRVIYNKPPLVHRCAVRTNIDSS